MSTSPRCPHCHLTDAQCSSRTWSCPADAGGCGATGPDCAGIAIPSCPKGASRNAPHVALAFSAPNPRRPLYRFEIVLGDRNENVVCDGSRVFLVRGRKVGQDVTCRIVAAGEAGVDALLMLRDSHAALVRVDAMPWGGETADETLRNADRSRASRRTRAA